MFKGLPFQPRHHVGLSMVAALLGTALVSPLYPIYQDQWGLSAGDISNIYVVYMVGALSGLIFLGRMGDRIGFLATLQISLCVALIGSLICMISQDGLILSVGRFLAGVAGTMATSSGVVGLNQLAPEHKKPHVALKGSLLVAMGFALGPLVGGIIGQWARMPLVMVHVPSLIIMALSLVILMQMKPGVNWREIPSRLGVGDFLPKLTWPKGPEGVTFGLGTIMAFITFGVFGLNAAMAPTLVRTVLGLGGPLVSGLGIALILTGSCLTQISFKRMNYFRSAMIGFCLLSLSSVIMIVNLKLGATWLFGLGLLITAMGHGAAIFAGAQVVNRIADDTNRASLTASFWAVGYFGSILPMLGTGIMADLWGLNVAVLVFSLCVIVLCVLGMTAFISVRTARRKAAS